MSSILLPFLHPSSQFDRWVNWGKFPTKVIEAASLLTLAIALITGQPDSHFSFPLLLYAFYANIWWYQKWKPFMLPLFYQCGHSIALYITCGYFILRNAKGINGNMVEPQLSTVLKTIQTEKNLIQSFLYVTSLHN